MGRHYVYHTPGGEVAEPGVACKYVDINRNEPSCIVAHILHDHGVPLETLGDHESQSAGTVLKQLRISEILNFTMEASRFLDNLQWIQDKGKTWSEALSEARSVTTDVG